MTFADFMSEFWKAVTTGLGMGAVIHVTSAVYGLANKIGSEKL